MIRKHRLLVDSYSTAMITIRDFNLLDSFYSQSISFLCKTENCFFVKKCTPQQNLSSFNFYGSQTVGRLESVRFPN